MRDTGTEPTSPPIVSSGPADGPDSVSAPTNTLGGSTSRPAPELSSGAVLPPVCFPPESTLAIAPGSSTAPAPAPSAAPPPDSSAAPSRTRLQDGIRKPKKFIDGTVQYAYSTTSDEPYNV
jgi:hypothetical protein